MKRIGLLRNTIQEYGWGSRTAIAELLGQPAPTDTPQAELWMGTHLKAVSRVWCKGHWRSLLEVVQENPAEVLGTDVAQRFSDNLPFLFKVLAADRPLSIQAHPNRDQARQGYARENEAGLPLDSPRRNYRDGNHKPEIICALTPFWALNGFCRIEEILRRFGKIRVPSLAGEIDTLRRWPNRQGLRNFFSDLMTLAREQQERALDEALTSIELHTGEEPVFGWILKLNREYPGDIGVLSTILLNLVRLEPGQAMYLPAGELHAYLGGVGMELMANSDNVLRGGLTPKHVDINELVAILSFAGKDVEVLTPTRLVSGEEVYETHAEEFVLSVISVGENSPFTSDSCRSVEIMICTNGEARVTDLSISEVTSVNKGTSIVIPAALEQYRIEGNATLYKATVPLGKEHLCTRA
jgi:mannose-6-phosphate isomerase